MLKGTLLNNRYEILDTIGIGGMAYVYKAFDKLLERYVAIKILKEDFARTEDFLNKFKLEATSAASLSDENIVGIYDVGNEIINGVNTEYIVMEMIEGKTLKSIIDEEAPLSNERVIYYAKQIALALQAAHRKGVVHRDIKPANILINKQDKVKVTDFGIARVSSQQTLTYTSSILGTVHYISPEQAKGLPTDNRSDLYSLGIVLYEMATGKVPFDADTPVSIAIKHLQEEPTPIRELNPDIDPNLEKIINKLLSKELPTRYQTATELFSNLDNYKDVKIHVKNKATQKLEKSQIKSNKAEYVSEKKRRDKSEDEKRRFSFWWILLPLIGAGLLYLLISYMGDVAEKSKLDRLISVPNVYEFSESDAITRLTEVKLSPEINGRRNDNKIPKGTVIEQSIEPNEKVEPGTVVKLTISSGPELVSVPRLTNLSKELALEEIEKFGLSDGQVTEQYSTKPKGTVIEQEPRAYEKVEKGTNIDLIVSLGEEEVKSIVPNIKGYDQSSAINLLFERNLRNGEIGQIYSNKAAGTVVSQAINPGTEVEAGTAIDFKISRGPRPLEEEKPVEPPEPPEENNTDVPDKNYVFNINAPESAESFNVKIYNTKDTRELLKEETFQTADLKDKIAVINLVAPSNAKFEILINDKVADVQYD